MMPGPDEKPGGPEESFVARWSRRKEEARRPSQAADAPAAEAPGPAPVLPPVEELTPQSDFRPFFHPKVTEDVRRAALKKLFSDPHFNVMDGLDVYIDDYSKTEPIPAAMLAQLRQAANILGWAKEDEERRAQQEKARLGAEEEAALAAPESPATTAPALVATSTDAASPLPPGEPGKP